jgi:carbonic anhydrase
LKTTSSGLLVKLKMMRSSLKDYHSNKNLNTYGLAVPTAVYRQTLVVENDLNCLSVIQFAVEALRVKHIIVCGHYGCGGVKTVMEDKKLGLIDNWLKNIHTIKEKNSSELSKIEDQFIKFNKMCELNVIEQVKNVCNTKFVQSAWQNKQKLSVHGWIYDISDGLLQDLDVCITASDELYVQTEKAKGKLFHS